MSIGRAPRCSVVLLFLPALVAINFQLLLFFFMPQVATLFILSDIPIMARKGRSKKTILCKKGKNDSILQEWIQHNNTEFHHFPPNQANEIRQSLLDWYRANRRKLPWRGDAPPFEGSTAGIASKKTTTKVVDSKSQPSITSYFAGNSTKKQKKATTADNNNSNNDDDASSTKNNVPNDQEAIPTSGYGVWVSEIMLQQTRVEAVIPYWLKWMKSFPTVQHLADATEEEVNAHWAGLGFYRRARLLHKGAKHVVQPPHNGQLPTTVDELLKIDGIGPYTASAIASIAFDVCVPVVDGNVCRVLSRLRGIANHIKAPVLKDKLGWDLATQIVQAGDGKHAGEVNQALMELGATYCAPSGTGIDPCDPLKEFYMSTQLGRAYFDESSSTTSLLSTSTTKHSCELCAPNGITMVIEKFAAEFDEQNISNYDSAGKIGHSIFPLDPPKQEKREEDLVVMVLSNTWQNDTWWLLVKRISKGLLAGQWEFPSTCVRVKDKNSPPHDKIDPGIKIRKNAMSKLLRQALPDHYDQIKLSPVGSAPIEHIFSHVKHIMWIQSSANAFELDELEWMAEINVDKRQLRWMRESDMKEVGITSGVNKVLKLVKQNNNDKLPAKKRQKTL